MTLQTLCKATKFAVTSIYRPSFLSFNVRHLRDRGYSKRRSLSATEFKDFLDVDDEDTSEDILLDDLVGGSDRRHFEEFITNVDFRDPEIRRDLERLAKLERNKLKKKIIEKKYFKKNPEKNVLTWQAKEQIRYLNQEYPEEWTIDKLIESFPVSREGVIGILKSTYLPSDEKEIRKHDDKAILNINDIKKKLADDTETLDSEEREELEDKILKIGSAAGIKDLPLTKVVTRRTIAAQSKLLKPPKKIGPFTSMLMYYDRVVEGDTQIQDHKYILLPEPVSAEGRQTSKVKGQENEQVEKVVKQSGNFELNLLEEKNLYKKEQRPRLIPKFKDDLFVNKNSEQAKQNRAADLLDDFQERTIEKTNIMSNLQQSNRSECVNSELKNLQKENIKFSDNYLGKKSFQKWNPKSEQYSQDSFGKIVTEKVPYTNRTFIESNEEMKPVRISRRRQTSFYQKGKTVYDEQGDFLYKVP
ncbi:NGRN [Mytilus coruscus]|uniref:NGRN n=1 Tax=Mytilus coruscus TaxID=42192 RepID=A0A6J8BTP4_MYTCO|nr:NGRN [Mytilus coruscus]